MGRVLSVATMATIHKPRSLFVMIVAVLSLFFFFFLNQQLLRISEIKPFQADIKYRIILIQVSHAVKPYLSPV